MSELNRQPPPDHSVKVAHLVFGLLFLGIAGIWALVVTDVITSDRLTIIAPALLIGVGVIGLAASLASSRNKHQARRASEYDAVAATDDLPQGWAEDDAVDDHTQEIR